MTERSRVVSKDYWDHVLDQLGHRPLARLSIALLALLYGAAIYAPFLANDRPLLLEATDRAAYNKAHRTLYPISLNLRGMIREGEEAHAAGEAQQSFAEALAGEREAIALRARQMADQLPPERAALLEELLAAATRAVETRSEEAAGEVVELAKRVRTELAAGEDGVELVSQLRYPVLEALTRTEVYLMVLWALVLTWPLWNGLLVNRLLLRGDRERRRAARRPKLAAMVLLPLVPALLWQGTEASFDVSPFKQGLSSGEIEPSRVVWPPIRFGYAETHVSEKLRAPTWHEDAEMTEAGRYARGARAATTDARTGFEVPATPVEIRAGEPDLNETLRHPLGTDSLGRDVLARIVWGGRISLQVGLISTVVLVVVGVLLGALAGYFGRWVDTVVSRVIEVFQCFPVFFLILILVAFVGPSVLNIMLVIGLLRWTGVARLVRGEFIRLREQEFVVASVALGVSPLRTIFRHVLPNALGPVLVAATFAIAAGILTESALSFLGFGISAPIPSWGSLLIESSSSVDWWIQVYPGLMIFLTVILYNVVGEGLRDALDPRLKRT